jgi:hypothetical protein
MPSTSMTGHISLTDFAAQIDACNVVRQAAGLPPLDPAEAVPAAIREWCRLLEDARSRLRRGAGRDLANNWFTHQIISRQAGLGFHAYLATLTRPEAGDVRR